MITGTFSLAALRGKYPGFSDARLPKKNNKREFAQVANSKNVTTLVAKSICELTSRASAAVPALVSSTYGLGIA